jgi:hypothetical protein
MAQTLAAPTSAATRWAQYYALTKPRVVQLIVFCAVIGMLLAEPGCPIWPGALPAAGRASGWWPAAAAAFNCLVEQHIDARMARTAWRPTAKGQLTDWQTLLFSAVLCACRQCRAVGVGQPADDVADLCHLRRLCRRLHRGAQAADAAEHRDRRRVGRHAAGAGLGRDDAARWARGADPVPDHLPVDPAALLGAGAVPRRGLPPGRPADAAHHARVAFTRLQVLLYTWCCSPPRCCPLCTA